MAAVAALAGLKFVSVSLLQRKLHTSYNQTAPLLERMEREGLVGPKEGDKPREVLIGNKLEKPAVVASAVQSSEDPAKSPVDRIPAGTGESHKRDPELREPVASEEGSTNQVEAPASAQDETQHLGAGASRLEGSGSGSGEPSAAPAAAKSTEKYSEKYSIHANGASALGNLLIPILPKGWRWIELDTRGWHVSPPAMDLRPIKKQTTACGEILYPKGQSPSITWMGEGTAPKATVEKGIVTAEHGGTICRACLAEASAMKDRAAAKALEVKHEARVDPQHEETHEQHPSEQQKETIAQAAAIEAEPLAKLDASGKAANKQSVEEKGDESGALPLGPGAPVILNCEMPDCKEPGVFAKDSGGYFCEKFAHLKQPKSIRREFHFIAHPELKPRRGRPPKNKAVSNG